eukprot:TRINITY_DN3156_c0_g1_i1.p1 TRINITY_DN3156_c0_g1~~TRINITY_DN3156_c0_g1_i1.p1  ORF type:complete len:1732 (-),score=366.74 TRINITY_DN3156_c0_g1_i1:2-5197(-)
MLNQVDPSLPNNKISKLVFTQAFEWTFLAVIVIDCVVIACNSPLYPRDSSLARGLAIVDYVCTALFTLEMILRIIASGPMPYFRSVLNILDTGIIIVSWATFFSTERFLWYLRPIRIFRPLRAIRALPDLQQLVHGLSSTVYDIFPLLIMLFLFYAMYAIMGSYFFAGTFRYFCFDPQGNQEPAYALCSPWGTGVRPCPDAYNICSEAVPMLTNAFGLSLFDNIYWSMLMVFQICTMENWSVLMMHAWRSTSAISVVFFCTCLVLGSFVFLNMFLAGVARSFDEKIEKLQRKSEDLAPLPTELVEARKMSLRRASSVMYSKRFSANPADPLLIRQFSASRADESEQGDISSADEDDNIFAQPRGRLFSIVDENDLRANRTSHADVPVQTRLVRSQSLEDFKAPVSSLPAQEAVLHAATAVDVITVPAADTERRARRVSHTTDDLMPTRRTPPSRTLPAVVRPEFHSQLQALVAASGPLPTVPSTAAPVSAVDDSPKSASTAVTATTLDVLSPSQMTLSAPMTPALTLTPAAPLPRIEHSPVAAQGMETFPPALPSAAYSDRSEQISDGSARVSMQSALPSENSAALPSENSAAPSDNSTRVSFSAEADVAQDAIVSDEDGRPSNVTASSEGRRRSTVVSFASIPLVKSDSQYNMDAFVRKRSNLSMVSTQKEEELELHDCWPSDAPGGQTRCCIAAANAMDHSTFGRFWNKLRSLCNHAVNNRIWSVSVTILIALNTLVLAAHHYGEPQWLADAITITNTVLAALFLVELAVSLLANGFRYFIGSPMNVVDAVVTIAAVLQLGISSSGVSTALRVLRVMRLLQFIKVWPGMASMVPTIVQSTRQSIYFFILLMILLFCYAILGMCLFAGRLVPTFEDAASFDTFWPSFVTAFQILTVSNWPNIAYDLVVGSGSNLAPLYCVSLIIVSSYVMLNLFVGLLMEKFSEQTDAEQNKRLAEFLRESLAVRLYSKKHKLSTQSSELQRYVDQQQQEYLAERNDHIHISLSYESLFLFDKNNSLRKFCRAIVSHPAFNIMVVLIVIANSVALAWQSPLNSASTLWALNVLNVVFLVLFSVEFIMLVVMYGFVLHPGSYLRNPWNVLDFVALVFTIVDCSVTTVNLAWVRAFRILRPLRLISNSRSMRLTAASLVRSMQAMAGLLSILLVVWVIFAIVGVQLWAGTFYQCSEPDITIQANCTGISTVTGAPLQWSSTYFPNFDNVAFAMLALFQVATLQSWEQLSMYAAASTSVGEGPVLGNSPSAAIYFISFIIVGALFMMNLFIGVTVDNYHRERSVFEGTVLMTQPQREWWLIAKTLVNCKPEYLALPPTQQWRLALYNLVESRAWSFIVAGVAIGNAAVLMAWVTDPGQTLRDFSFWSGVAFSVIFIAEVLIEAIARGLRVYFSQGWGRFDTLIAIAAFCDIFITDPTASNVFVAFRALRIIQIARQIPRPLMVLRVLAAAFPQLISVGILLLFVYYIYAILGVNFFGSIALQGNLSEASNFASFPVAFLTMFRISSMDGWNDLMVSCMVQPPDCTAGVDCGFSAAPVFFVTFQLLCGFIMVNLFVAVLLGTLLNLTELNKSIASPKTIDTYAHVWSLFDPNATGFIKYDDLTNFRVRLPPPFGVPAFLSTAARYETMLPLKIPITTDGRVQYISVLLELTRHVVGVSLPPNATLFIRGQIEHALELEELSPWAVRDHAAAALIQIWWRGVRTRHNIAQLQQRMRSLRGISMSS